MTLGSVMVTVPGVVVKAASPGLQDWSNPPEAYHWLLKLSQLPEPPRLLPPLPLGSQLSAVPKEGAAMRNRPVPRVTIVIRACRGILRLIFGKLCFSPPAEPAAKGANNRRAAKAGRQ